MKTRSRMIPLVGIVLCMLFLTGLAPGQANAARIPPRPTVGYVLDELGWLKGAQLAEAKSILEKLEQDTSNEVALVTLNDCGPDSKLYRNELFRAWGIGKKDKNNGLLLLVCWYGGEKGKRKLETEVGYGLEGTLPDLLTSNYAKLYFNPAFATAKKDVDVIASGDAGAALINLVKAYEKVLRGEAPVQSPEQDTILTIVLVCLFLALCVLLIALYRHVSGSGSGSFIGDVIDVVTISGSSDSGSSFGGGDSGGGGSSSDF